MQKISGVAYSFLVIGNQNIDGVPLDALSELFPQYFCAGMFPNNKDILKDILRIKPQLILFNTVSNALPDTITIKALTDFLEHTKQLPYVVVLSTDTNSALEALQNGVSDFLTNLHLDTLSRCLAKFERKVPFSQQKSICIKSYSDYHFLKYNEIVYLKADNNSTDFKTITGAKVTAYKTLKYFESVLPPYFIRIHKSYIVNIHFISRIQFSKSKCFLNLDEVLPFSDSYRSSVEQILTLNLIGS